MLNANNLTSNHGLETLNFINFNQDGSCISIGTNKGYKIFNCEPFGKCFQRNDIAGGGIGIVEMLFSTSLIAITGLGDQPSMSPRRLKIINTKRNSTICELTFPTTILSVKMNKSRLIVLLEEQVYIYDITNMRLLHTIETSPNPHGLCALSPSIDNNYFAYPSPPRLVAPNNSNNSNQQTLTNEQLINDPNNPSNSTTPNPNPTNSISGKQHNGDVIIFNAQTLQPLIVVEAHKTVLAAMAVSYDGTLLATASDKGTIVRVFSTDTGAKLYQFRRGTYPTKIYALSFSRDNKYLSASSATETVHIFKLGDDTVDSNAILSDDTTDLPKPSFQNTRTESSESDTSAINAANRRSSISSYDSVNSGDVDGHHERYEPLIDISRKTVGRMIRKSSQNIGRRAAEKIGTFLPPKLTSMLEPTRRFASLKVPASQGVKNVVYIGQESEIPKTGLPLVFSEQDIHHDSEDNNDSTSALIDDEGSSTTLNTSQDGNLVKLIHVLVVSSEGYYYNYGLDPERGGDCILLNQYSLTDGQ